MVTGRRVVLLCGPPGAGKSTVARTMGLAVYDRDDPQWRGSEQAFVSALRTLPARAVVIRAGATLAARHRTARRIGATEIQVLATDPATCRARVLARARPVPPIEAQLAGVGKWWRTYEPEPAAAGPDNRSEDW